MSQIFMEILHYIMHVFIDIYLLLNILSKRVMPYFLFLIVMDKTPLDLCTSREICNQLNGLFALFCLNLN